MRYHTSYAFTASPEVVFDVLTDLDLVTLWLDEDLPISRQSDGTVMVRDASEYRVLFDSGTLKLSWEAVCEAEDWWGRAVVRALPLSGSVVDVKLAVPAAFQTQIDRVDRILSRVLRRLDEEAGRRGRSADNTLGQAA